MYRETLIVDHYYCFYDDDYLKIYRALLKSYKPEIIEQGVEEERLEANALDDLDNLTEQDYENIADWFQFDEINTLNEWLYKKPLATLMVYKFYGADGLVNKLRGQRPTAEVMADPLYKKLRENGLDAVDAMNYMEYNPCSGLEDYELDDPEGVYEDFSWAPFPSEDEEEYYKNHGEELYSKQRELQLYLLHKSLLTFEFSWAFHHRLNTQYSTKFLYERFLKRGDGFIVTCQELYLLILEILEQQDRILHKRLDLLPPVLQLRYLMRRHAITCKQMEQNEAPFAYTDLGYDLSLALDEYLKDHPEIVKDPLKLVIDAHADNKSLKESAFKYRKLISLRKHYIYMNLYTSLWDPLTRCEQMFGMF